MNWKVKAVVQKAVSYMPYKKRINYMMQKYITKGVHLSDEYFLDRLTHASHHIQAFKKWTASEVDIPRTTFELGSGWYPVVPLSMYLCGAENISTIDIDMHTSKEKINTTIDNKMAN